MEVENEALGPVHASRFVVVANLAANDAHWESDDEHWVGKASMGKRHRFLTTRDLSWRWFNVLAFGLDGDAASLREAITTLEAMRDAAIAFASATPGWSPAHLGMFFHCFPHNSVQGLHLHLVDLRATGPTFQRMTYKNLSLSTCYSSCTTRSRRLRRRAPQSRATSSLSLEGFSRWRGCYTTSRRFSRSTSLVLPRKRRSRRRGEGAG